SKSATHTAGLQSARLIGRQALAENSGKLAKYGVMKRVLGIRLKFNYFKEIGMSRRSRRLYGGFIFDEEASFRRAMGLVHQIDSASQSELEYDIALDYQDRLLILLYGK